ncbi:MAG: hypothetical protein GY749_28885 [Desulfobacteraceae bacterium]|nr:hypothetical protein [Desulfobacteraceae bacterium]
MLRVGMQGVALCADIPDIGLSVRKSKLHKTTGTLKISAQSATACIPTRSMGTRFFYKTGRLEFTNSIMNCRAIVCRP